MDVFYYKSEFGNFGDDLNLQIWRHFIPNIDTIGAGKVLVGIGTILDPRLNDISTNELIVFGSGVRNPKRLPIINQDWNILGVRGPLSASALGLGAESVIGDPAYLLRVMEPSKVKKTFRISYMSHMSCRNHTVWKTLLTDIGINYIRPDLGVQLILEQIKASDVLITEAMHGAIAADAFRIPFFPVRVYSTANEGGINRFKWGDWSQSMGLDLEPIPIKPIPEQQSTFQSLKNRLRIRHIKGQIRKILKGEAHLSSQTSLDSTLERQVKGIEALRLYLLQD